MNERGEIFRLDPDALTEDERRKLIMLSEKQAEILLELDIDKRAELYPLMSRRERRAAQRAARKSK